MNVGKNKRRASNKDVPRRVRKFKIKICGITRRVPCFRRALFEMETPLGACAATASLDSSVPSSSAHALSAATKTDSASTPSWTTLCFYCGSRLAWIPKDSLS